MERFTTTWRFAWNWRVWDKSEVPVGVFLSGGLDSSAIKAIMCRVSGQRVKTFSVGYEGNDAANEFPFARKIADYFGADRNEFILKPYDFLDSIPQMVKIAEAPGGDAGYPLYQLSKAAKPHATVLLSGDGSDEVFDSYGWYPLRGKGATRCSAVMVFTIKC